MTRREKERDKEREKVVEAELFCSSSICGGLLSAGVGM